MASCAGRVLAYMWRMPYTPEAITVAELFVGRACAGTAFLTVLRPGHVVAMPSVALAPLQGGTPPFRVGLRDPRGGWAVVEVRQPGQPGVACGHVARRGQGFESLRLPLRNTHVRLEPNPTGLVSGYIDGKPFHARGTLDGDERELRLAIENPGAPLDGLIGAPLMHPRQRVVMGMVIHAEAREDGATLYAMPAARMYSAFRGLPPGSLSARYPARVDARDIVAEVGPAAR